MQYIKLQTSPKLESPLTHATILAGEEKMIDHNSGPAGVESMIQAQNSSSSTKRTPETICMHI